jgi:hypothetical protein
VCASVGGLAHAARVGKEDCEAALGYLLSPDDDSRSREFDGQRIEVVDGGYIILNYKKYRDLGRKIDRDEYLADKQWEHRQKRKQTSTSDNGTSTNPSASASLSESASKRKPKTLEETVLYAKQHGISSADATAFFDSMEAGGWTRNGKALRDWQAALRSWKANGFLASQRNNRGHQQPTKADYKRNYLPPANELTDEQFEAQKKVALEECAKAKAALNP